MHSKTVSTPLRKGQSPADAVAQITLALSRFSLMVDILEKLSFSDVPLPGDADIRHGCERALTSMLSELAHIERVEDGEAEVLMMTPEWNTSLARRLIDADRLERVQQFIDSIMRPAACK